MTRTGTFRCLFPVLGLVSLGTLSMGVAPVAAQSARYCSDSLVANSFYSNVLRSAGGGADVEYHGQFQNQDTRRRKMTIVLTDVTRISTYQFVLATQRFDLDSYQQKDIVLAKTHTTSQSGIGAPTPAQMSHSLRLLCTFG